MRETDLPAACAGSVTFACALTPQVDAREGNDVLRTWLAGKALPGAAGGTDLLRPELIGFLTPADILRAVVHEPPLDLWT